MQNKVILIVEDEKLVREIVRLHLGGLGFIIIEAENGQEAYNIAARGAIDLIISDIQMPLMSGVELLKNLRELNAGYPPFVFTTAYSDISSAEALALGAEAFLRKPFAKRELLDVVENALLPKEVRWSQGEIISESARCFDLSPFGEFWRSKEETQSKIEIGQGGMFLPLLDKFPCGFEVFKFKIESGLETLGDLEGFAQVRWVRQVAELGESVGIGVEFLQLDDPYRKKLLDHIAVKEPKSYIPLGIQEPSVRKMV
jgi:two-component system chemotaxis response regulator CheY